MRVHKREITVDDVCTGLDFYSIWTEAVADISMDINAVPVLSDSVGIATSSISAVSHMTKAGTEMGKVALGCDDIPFQEIKDIMMAKFGDINRKMDLNIRVMENMVSVATQAFNLAQKTQLEMRRGFKRMLKEVTNADVREKIDQISDFAEYFSSESVRINALPTEEYVAKLEEEDSILFLLKDSRTPKVDSLYTAINDIVLNKDAIPKNENDSTAFQALLALFYGAQTYVSLLGFLVKANSFLTDYYYLNGDYEKFNAGIDSLTMILDDFKSSLLDETSGIIPKIDNVLQTVRNKSFMNNVKTSLYKQVESKTKLLEIFKNQINKITLPIIDEVPLTPMLQFDEPFYNTPIGEWKEGAVVKYAAQYREKERYSKLSDWSDPVTVRNKAFLTISTSENDSREKFIFRQFNDDPPELVYKLGGEFHKIRDHFRDYFNAAANPDTDLAFTEAKRALHCCGEVVSSHPFELGRTAFHNIAMTDNVKLFEYLEKYASVEHMDDRDERGYTPFHVAAQHGSTALINIYFKEKANPRLKTYTEGYTPLHLAVLHGMAQAVQVMVGREGVDVNASDNSGFTPLHLTVRGGHHLIQALLEDEKINLNAKSKTGLTLAHLAAIQGDFDFFDTLKGRERFNVNEVDMSHLTPLHYAAMMGHDDMVENMLSKLKNLNVNVHGKNNNWTPLHYAIFFKKSDAALKIIKHSKTNVNAKASNDVSALHMAAGTGQHDLVEALLNKRAEKDAQTKEGDTPLHLAAMNDCELCVTYLVDKGAATHIKNKKNETPLDLASKFGDASLAQKIKSKSGKRYRKNLDFDIHRISNKTAESLYPAMQSGTSCIGAHCRSRLQLGRQSNIKTTHPLNLSIDGNGTLMLLDLLLKKLYPSDDKFGVSLSGNVSEIDAQLKALDITEKFEKFLNLINSVPVEEQIDLSKVSSKLKKALMGDRGKEVVYILCSFAESIKTSNPGDLESLLNTFKSGAFFEPTKQSEELFSLMKNTCH